MILGTGGQLATEEQIVDFLRFAMYRGIELNDLWVADDAGTIAIMTADKNNRPGVTTDLNVSYFSAGRTGEVILVDAEVLKTGRNMAYVSVDLRRGEGKAQGVRTGSGVGVKHSANHMDSLSTTPTPDPFFDTRLRPSSIKHRNQSLQPSPIAEMLDFQHVPRCAHVADAIAQVEPRLRFQTAEALRAPTATGLRCHKPCDQLPLIMRQAPQSAVGLNQSGYKQIVVLGLEHVEK